MTAKTSCKKKVSCVIPLSLALWILDNLSMKKTQLKFQWCKLFLKILLLIRPMWDHKKDALFAVVAAWPMVTQTAAGLWEVLGEGSDTFLEVLRWRPHTFTKSTIKEEGGTEFLGCWVIISKGNSEVISPYFLHLICQLRGHREHAQDLTIMCTWPRAHNTTEVQASVALSGY